MMNYVIRSLLSNMSVSLGYIILFCIGAPANLLVLYKLLHGKCYRRSRYHFLLLNLSLADSMVVFIMIPVEIGWLYTNAWLAGNVACKVIKFFCAFGPYSSSLLLICLSVDRYYAVARPFSYAFLDRQMNILLMIIWSVSLFISLPQLVIFSVKNPPDRPNFTQCVDFDFFPEKWQEQTYTITSLVFLYFLPLIVIIFCYSAISCIIVKRSRIEDEKSTSTKAGGTVNTERASLTNVIEMDDLVIGNGAREDDELGPLTRQLIKSTSELKEYDDSRNITQTCDENKCDNNVTNVSNNNVCCNKDKNQLLNYTGRSVMGQITVNPLECQINDSTLMCNDGHGKSNVDDATSTDAASATTPATLTTGQLSSPGASVIHRHQYQQLKVLVDNVTVASHQNEHHSHESEHEHHVSSSSIGSSVKTSLIKSEVHASTHSMETVGNENSPNSRRVEFNTITTIDESSFTISNVDGTSDARADIEDETCISMSTSPNGHVGNVEMKSNSELKIDLLTHHNELDVNKKCKNTDLIDDVSNCHNNTTYKSTLTTMNNITSGEQRSSSRTLCQGRVMIRKNSIKRRILNQTLVIIITFLVCWTPYVFIAMWYQIDAGAVTSGGSSTDYLFMFAVSNSVVNPYIYGKFLFK